MYTKKNYQQFAKLINESDGNMDLDCFVASKLIPYFQQDNPRFNKEKFLKACYP